MDMGNADTARLGHHLAVSIEPDLRLLKGLVTVLRYLGERPAGDAIDPAALAALATAAEDAVDRLIGLQRETR